jgi:amidase
MAIAIAVATFVTFASAAARTINFDAATIADINAAFDAGTLTSEGLTRLCLARIAAFDRRGPSLHAVMALNPKALEQARALDAERKAKGRRSPLHGIPVVLKDNYDTFDMATTGGSILLEGSIPSQDAFMVKKLRDAARSFSPSSTCRSSPPAAPRESSAPASRS